MDEERNLGAAPIRDPSKPMTAYSKGARIDRLGSGGGCQCGPERVLGDPTAASAQPGRKQRQQKVEATLRRNRAALPDARVRRCQAACPPLRARASAFGCPDEENEGYGPRNPGKHGRSKGSVHCGRNAQQVCRSREAKNKPSQRIPRQEKQLSYESEDDFHRHRYTSLRFRPVSQPVPGTSSRLFPLAHGCLAA